MGKKVSPIIFRSIESPFYKNIWSVETFKNSYLKTSYKHKLNIYLNLYHSIIYYFKKNNLELLKTNFKFTNTQVLVFIVIPYGNIKKSYFYNMSNELLTSYVNLCNLWITNIKSLLIKIYGYKFPKILFRLCFIKEQFFSPEFLLLYIKSQIKRSIPIRKILKQTYSLIIAQAKNEKLRCNGLKICVSGRIQGINRSRKETLIQNNIPLHTIKSNIKYATSTIKTPYGILGLKIWLFISN